MENLKELTSEMEELFFNYEAAEDEITERGAKLTLEGAIRILQALAVDGVVKSSDLVIYKERLKSARRKPNIEVLDNRLSTITRMLNTAKIEEPESKLLIKALEKSVQEIQYQRRKLIGEL